ncbi:hypothetical protein CO054_02030, partial [Candidatus Shapirobacteria bacterium CG_4_9_14_0_2_um_filter_39_11]
LFLEFIKAATRKSS